MLDAIITQLLHPGTPDVFGDSAGLKVAKLLERFIGYSGPIGTIADIAVPSNCTWQDTLHNDHIELEFINPPILKVEKSFWFLEMDIDATLNVAEIYLTHIILKVRAMGRNREERFELDWTGP